MRKETEFGSVPKEWSVRSVFDLKSHDDKALAMGPFGSNIKAENFVSSGVPVIRGSNMNYSRYVSGNFVCITEQKSHELRSSLCKADDLVFTHRGTIGQVCLIPRNSFEKYIISQSGMKLTVDIKKILPNFLFYFFKSESGQYQLLKYESQVGVPSISNPLTSLKEITVPVPPLPEQKAIAGVLSSLDDKIDLLHRQNKTLETMAETLFRQWFIEESQDDWEEKQLKDEFQIIMGQSPKSSSFNDTGNGFPMFQGNADFGFRFPKNRIFTTEPTRFALSLETLISVRAPVGEQNMALQKCCIGRGVAAVRHLYNIKWYTYTYFKLKSILQEIRQFNEQGTVFGSITKSDFESLATRIPPNNKISFFEETAKPINDKIILNCNQIQTLEKLRDTLLPRLMRGEIRVQYDNTAS